MATDELAKKMFHATSFLLWYSDNHVSRLPTVAVAEVLEAASYLHCIAFLQCNIRQMGSFQCGAAWHPKETLSPSTSQPIEHILSSLISSTFSLFSFIQEGELEYIFPYGAVITSGRARRGRGREPSSRMGDETCRRRRLGNKVSLFEAITLPERKMS